jgi:hypothetical protein
METRQSQESLCVRVCGVCEAAERLRMYMLLLAGKL